MKKVETKSYEGQKPGTSGLRKSVKTFQQPNYTENFIQAILSALGDRLENSVLVVGGDGRYFGKEAVSIITKIAAANKVCIEKQVWTKVKLVFFINENDLSLGRKVVNRPKWDFINTSCFLHYSKV